MTQNAYDRAVATFEALVNAPRQGAHAAPARLIQSAGLPASSGYRHVAALEAEGFLRRDTTGTYLPGFAGLRIGLQGYGLGRLAPLAQPILLQLRQLTQHSAFMAVVQDMEVYMGPHYLGRETRNTRLVRHYSFETIPDLDTSAVSEIGLRYVNGGIARRLGVLMVALDSTPSSIMTIGLVINPSRGPSDTLIEALDQAHAQIARALDKA